MGRNEVSRKVSMLKVVSVDIEKVNHIALPGTRCMKRISPWEEVCKLQSETRTSDPGKIHLSMKETVEEEDFCQTTMLLLYIVASRDTSNIPHHSVFNILFL